MTPLQFTIMMHIFVAMQVCGIIVGIFYIDVILTLLLLQMGLTALCLLPHMYFSLSSSLPTVRDRRIMYTIRHNVIPLIWLGIFSMGSLLQLVGMLVSH